MDFEDLGTDVNLECPHCNRRFQQQEAGRDDPTTVECPHCQEPVDRNKAANKQKT